MELSFSGDTSSQNLTNQDYFDPLPNMTQKCFEFIGASILCKFNFIALEHDFKSKQLNLYGEKNKEGNNNPEATANNLRLEAEATLTKLWRTIKDNPFRKNIHIIHHCWIILYDYPNENGEVSIRLHLSFNFHHFYTLYGDGYLG